MIKFYSDALNEELKEEVLKILDHTVDEQYQLREEFALYRVLTKRAVQVYSVLQSKDPLSVDTQAYTKELKKCLDQLANFADKSTSVEIKAQTKIASSTLSWFIESVIGVLQDEITDRDTRIRIETKLRDITRESNQSKQLSIEAAYFKMMDTVPNLPGLENDTDDTELEDL